MNINILKTLLKPLEMAGLKINDVIPATISAIRSYSEKINQKCYFFFSEENGILIFSIYATDSDGSLTKKHSYQVNDIETIFSIIENLKNESKIEPATIGDARSDKSESITDTDDTATDTDTSSE